MSIYCQISLKSSNIQILIKSSGTLLQQIIKTYPQINQKATKVGEMQRNQVLSQKLSETQTNVSSKMKRQIKNAKHNLLRGRETQAVTKQTPSAKKVVKKVQFLDKVERTRTFAPTEKIVKSLKRAHSHANNFQRKSSNTKLQNKACIEAKELPQVDAYQQMVQSYKDKYFIRETLDNISKIQQCMIQELKEKLEKSNKVRPSSIDDEYVSIKVAHRSIAVKPVDNISKLKQSRKIQTEVHNPQSQDFLEQTKQKKNLIIKKASQIKSTRPKTVPNQQELEDKEVKTLLRKQMNRLQDEKILPRSNTVVDAFKKMISSPHLKKVVNKQRLLDEYKNRAKNKDFTDITFNAKEHGTYLVGLFSRQYAPEFFENQKSKKVKLLLEELQRELLSKYTSKQMSDLLETLRTDSNSLILIYDTRVPREIRQSRNETTVNQSKIDSKPRVVGFAIFQQTYSQDYSGLFIHKIFGKDRKKQYKKKVLLALRAVQDQMRSEKVFVRVSKTDLDLYLKCDYNLVEMKQDELENLGIEKSIKGKLMVIETKFQYRDVKTKLQYDDDIELLAKSKKIEAGIQRYRDFIKDKEQDYIKKIKKSSKKWALKSDQAKTPKWLLRRIKRFTKIAEKHMKDVFPYRENWSAGIFYDGYKATWDSKYFHFVNSPFSQLIDALKKCADFQASGGNCALIGPAISINKLDLYREAIKYATIRVDLPLFAFLGFKHPLMRHIVLLYFLQPSFAAKLTKSKQKREIESYIVPLENNETLKIIHVPANLRKGRKKQELDEKEKNFIIEKYLCGGTINHIRKQLRKGNFTVRQYLNGYFGESTVQKEQGMRIERKYSTVLTDYLEVNMF